MSEEFLTPTNPTPTPAHPRPGPESQAWLKMNEHYYIILHKQFAHCNHRERGSPGEEEVDIGALFSFNRLGKGGCYSCWTLGQSQRGCANIIAGSLVKQRNLYVWQLRLNVKPWRCRGPTSLDSVSFLHKLLSLSGESISDQVCVLTRSLSSCHVWKPVAVTFSWYCHWCQCVCICIERCCFSIKFTLLC